MLFMQNPIGFTLSMLIGEDGRLDRLGLNDAKGFGEISLSCKIFCEESLHDLNGTAIFGELSLIGVVIFGEGSRVPGTPLELVRSLDLGVRDANGVPQFGSRLSLLAMKPRKGSRMFVPGRLVSSAILRG